MVITLTHDGTPSCAPEPKVSKQVYGVYLGPKGVPVYLLQGPSIYHMLHGPFGEDHRIVLMKHLMRTEHYVSSFESQTVQPCKLRRGS